MQRDYDSRDDDDDDRGSEPEFKTVKTDFILRYI